ncbi:melanin biosynthetic process [Nesidiocoris tenuis]|uniref:Melanin biosynthetic process n=2 Tax=Nesidiocoris tenuis TaxID=355587 RepID=A0ABN7B654_9HEMI|nr:melanin biosynthetic process [Nesidiocoris tenuis]
MDVIHSWKTPDFQFPTPEMKDAMLRTGAFIPENVAMIDVDVWENFNINQQKIFVTMPRLKRGIPATLATVGLTGLLNPYPAWNWHQEGDCEGITSVFRVDIDKCGRLWVLDSGNVEIFTNAKRICPPQILVFDLHTDRLLSRYRIPDDQLESKSLLITIAADARGPRCEDTHAYIADVVGYKLIVYDSKTSTSWRANNRYLYPYPTSSLFDINGVSFELTDGVMGLALGPINNYNDRKLYFHSFASHKENWVPTSVLRNRTLLTEGDPKMEFRLLEGGRKSQAAAQAMTPSGVLFFGLVTENSIACWNSRLSYSDDNIIRVAKDKKILQFASGIKARSGKIWVLTSRLQNYIAGEVDVNETNYRVVMGDIAKLTRGTKCQSRDNWPEESTRPTASTNRPGSSGYYSKPLIFN